MLLLRFKDATTAFGVTRMGKRENGKDAIMAISFPSCQPLVPAGALWYPVFQFRAAGGIFILNFLPSPPASQYSYVPTAHRSMYIRGFALTGGLTHRTWSSNPVSGPPSSTSYCTFPSHSRSARPLDRAGGPGHPREHGE